jgi:hypothetical protein
MNLKIDEKTAKNIIKILKLSMESGNHFASIERRAAFDDENLVFQMKIDNEKHIILQVMNYGLATRLKVDNFTDEQLADIVCKSVNL